MIISALPWQPAAGRPDPPLPPASDWTDDQIRTTAQTHRENERENKSVKWAILTKHTAVILGKQRKMDKTEKNTVNHIWRAKRLGDKKPNH